MKVVLKNPNNLPTVDYTDLAEFQEDLKTLAPSEYAKLKASFKERGFIVPVFIWWNEGRPWLMDGHQRKRVLTGENVEFIGEDRKPLGKGVPYVTIPGANRLEAKKNLLVITSQMGKISEQGFLSFTIDLPSNFLTTQLSFDSLPQLNLGAPTVQIEAPTVQTKVTVEKTVIGKDHRGNNVYESESEPVDKKHMLSIVLEKVDKLKWDEYKKSIKETKDTEAFLVLLQNWYMSDDEATD